jgi:hypothetical protein
MVTCVKQKLSHGKRDPGTLAVAPVKPTRAGKIAAIRNRRRCRRKEEEVREWERMETSEELGK